MADSWRNDDDALLAALKKALHPEEIVPEHVTRTAVASYAWYQIDAELAALTYDSATDDSELTKTRAESRNLRTLSFETNDVTFELEIRPDGIAGLLIAPPGSELELRPAKGDTVAVRVDQNGYFTIVPCPTVPFRLRCALQDGRSVSTALIVV
jgi:hypothetical protein